MRRTWFLLFTSLAVVLAVASGAHADNFADDQCAAANPLIVDDGPNGPKAQRVANGWTCADVDLIINSSLNVSHNTVHIFGRTVTIQTLGNPDDPAQRVQIIRDKAESVISIRSLAGDLVITGASIKARKIVRLQCNGPTCNVVVRKSDLIAASNLAAPAGGGQLAIFAGGSVDIQETNTHGGETFEITAENGSITLICRQGDTACKDPTVFPFPQIVEHCFDQQGNFIPDCQVTFPTVSDLRSVCIGAAGVTCNGGHKEKRFTARGDINMEGSTLTSFDHITIKSQEGKFLGAGSHIESKDAIVIIGDHGVDLRGAFIKAGDHMEITGGSSKCTNANPTDFVTCGIDATDAFIQGEQPKFFSKPATTNSVVRLCGAEIKGGGKVPEVNGDNNPPYGNRAIDTSAECAPESGALVNNQQL